MAESADRQRKRAQVTGAASGIGAAVARRFAGEGWHVALNDLDGAGLELTRAGLPAGQHIAVVGDYASEATSATLRAALAQNWGRLDALVSCAGISREVDALATPLPEWRQVMDTMVHGALAMSRLAAEFMPDGGRIVQVTSIHALRAARGASSYAMAKAAIEALVRALAVELADQRILVNAIAPGFVDTPMSRAKGTNELDTDWFRDNYVRGEHLPLRRAGRAEEIAGVAWFLCGADATYITGQTITVDGGLTITF